mmetsp:Transcript_77973/g.209287  ORF Transcript_77973/g.209287 Transcript_77973/m.209287 type:complete len:399 (+) Transcript_77973:723-1919(+)
MLPEEVAHLNRALLSPLHSQEHGLHAPQEEETLERCERCTLGVLQEGHPVCKLWVTNAHEPTSAVGMAGEELRRRVHHNVHPQGQGLADHRGHHGAVHADQHVALVCHGNDGPNVGDAHARVGRRLQVNHLGAWCNGLPDRFRVRGVHEGHLDAVVDAVLGEQPVHPSIDVLVAQHLVAHAQQPRDTMQGRHARCKRESSRGLLEHRDVLLERGPGRIARPRVVVGPELASGRLHEGGRLVDGRVRGVVRILGAAVEHNTLRGRRELVLEAREIRPDRKRGQVVVVAPARLRELDLGKGAGLPDGLLHLLQEAAVRVLLRARRQVREVVPAVLAPHPPHGVLEALGGPVVDDAPLGILAPLGRQDLLVPARHGGPPTDGTGRKRGRLADGLRLTADMA